MKCNVGPVDRTTRLIIAAGLIGLAFVTPYAWLALVALVPLLTAIAGYCPLYSAVGMDTAGRPSSPNPSATNVKA